MDFICIKPSPKQEKQLFPSHILKILKERNSCIFAARKKQEIIGISVWSVEGSKGQYGVLHYVEVCKEQRRSYVGTSLVEYGQKTLKTQGIKQFIANQVSEAGDNEEAGAFLASLGYLPVKTAASVLIYPALELTDTFLWKDRRQFKDGKQRLQSDSASNSLIFVAQGQQLGLLNKIAEDDLDFESDEIFLGLAKDKTPESCGVTKEYVLSSLLLSFMEKESLSANENTMLKIRLEDNDVYEFILSGFGVPLCDIETTIYKLS